MAQEEINENSPINSYLTHLHTQMTVAPNAVQNWLMISAFYTALQKPPLLHKPYHDPENKHRKILW